MSFVNNFKGVLLKPSDFFNNVSFNDDFFDPVIFALICNLIPGIILVREQITLNSLPFFLAGFLFIFIFRLFIDSAVLHGLFKLMGGKAFYQQTFEILSYSYIANLFIVIPILALQLNLLPVDFSLIFTLYGLYLIIIGGQFIHNLNIGKSAFAAFIWELWYLVSSFIIVTYIGIPI